LAAFSGGEKGEKQDKEASEAMKAAKGELSGYRPGIGIMLLSRDGLAFVGHRIHMPTGLAKWQMPQGGIGVGETSRQAALRELREELGTDGADILAESRGWFYHDVPDEIARGMMGGRYRGNRQKWLAMRFTGTDANINLVTENPEFDAWKWVSPEQLPELIAPFMRRLYLDVLAEFAPFWSGHAGS
jgi:putative (di)nucleoside polyphosphate hydrolase